MRREELRQTFDTAATDYHRARPRYPESLFDVLIEHTGLQPSSRLLEIGCGTGLATEPLARRGNRITCLELGPSLAHQAEKNLTAHSRVTIVNESFDRWEPPRWEAFDLVFAATSWHWLDPSSRFERAHRHLQPGGHLVFWSAAHVVPDDGDPFFAEIQEVYDEIGEGLPSGTTFPRPGELPDNRAEIDASGLFQTVEVRQFDWEVTYSAASYIALLRTFSGHIAMDEPSRELLFAEIRTRLGQRSDGRLRRHWGAVLHIARAR